MTRRAVVQKWILYSLCALALVLVQSLLLVRVQVWGVHPFLLPAIAVIPVTLERDEGALLFSVFFGLACDLLTPVAGLPCFYALAFLLGAAAIVLGAQLLIDNGTALAQLLHVPDSIIGATMIAIGTSLPELVTTITAIRKKQSDLSVGNIIGANLMDITLIMPLCALLLGKPLTVENQGMLLDIPACLIVSAGALVPALICGRFKRWIGFFIGGIYIVYLVIMFACFGV